MRFVLSSGQRGGRTSFQEEIALEIQADRGTVHALTWFVAASTAASGFAYLFIWGARFFRIEGGK
jgi:hypothetical protein